MNNLYSFALMEFLRDEANTDHVVDDSAIFLITGEALAITYYRVIGYGGGYERFKVVYSGLYDVLTASEVSKLLSNYILPTCGHEVVVKSKSENYIENEEIKRFFISFCGWLVRTYPYYKKMLDIYAAEENKLLDPVKSNTKTGFSDMPQTATFANAPTDDVLTNMTETESGSELNTKMQRINEIRAGYENIYNAWLDEYARTFIIY